MYITIVFEKTLILPGISMNSTAIVSFRIGEECSINAVRQSHDNVVFDIACEMQWQLSA